MTSIVILISLLSGCANAGLALINARAKLISKPHVTPDISYGDKEWQNLDLYIPAQKQQSTLPVLVFFYGGGWDKGNKEDFYFAAAAFSRRGYLVVVPDYVKYPQGKFPTFIEDGASAIAWVKNNINKHNGDDENIFIVGHSAGAHLGALLLADSKYLSKHGLKTNDIRAFAGLAGPYAFVPKAPRFTRIFEPPSNYPTMNVLNYIDGDEPPMLLAHGSSDKLVSVENKNSLINALKAVGVTSVDIDYPNVSHVSILLGLTSPLIGNANTSEDIDLFFQTFLQD